jgi:hypothetical protein
VRINMGNQYTEPDSTETHITKINNTLADLTANLDVCQMGIANDDGSIVWKDKDGNLLKLKPGAYEPTITAGTNLQYIAGDKSLITFPTTMAPNAHVLDSASHTISGKTAGQMLIATAAATYAFTSMGGDATLAGSGALTLANTITAGGPIGSGSAVPVITYDAKGRLTAVSSATITPSSIGAEVAGTVATHALLTTTAHGLGGSAFHGTNYYALASHNHAWADVSKSGAIAVDVGAVALSYVSGLTSGYIPYYNGTALANSILLQSGTTIGVNCTPTARFHISSSFSGGSGDYTDVVAAPLKLESEAGNYIRVPHVSASAGISCVYNYQTGKSVYWGEDTDTGNYLFRGRNVGINCTPTERLDVNGKVKATGAIFTNLTDGIYPYHVNDTNGLTDGGLYHGTAMIGVRAAPISGLGTFQVAGNADMALTAGYVAGTSGSALLIRTVDNPPDFETDFKINVVKTGGTTYGALCLADLGGDVRIGTTGLLLAGDTAILTVKGRTSAEDFSIYDTSGVLKAYARPTTAGLSLGAYYDMVLSTNFSGTAKSFTFDRYGDAYSVAYTDCSADTSLTDLGMSSTNEKNIKYKVIGKRMWLEAYVDGTRSASQFHINLPTGYSVKTGSPDLFLYSMNGTRGCVQVSTVYSTYIVLGTTQSTGDDFTTAGSKTCSFSINFEIN